MTNVFVSQVTSGFCNWKDATVAFSKHLQSKSDIEAVEAVEAVITLPKQTKDAHKAEKEEARDMLQIISDKCSLPCQARTGPSW